MFIRQVFRIFQISARINKPSYSKQIFEALCNVPKFQCTYFQTSLHKFQDKPINIREQEIINSKGTLTYQHIGAFFYSLKFEKQQIEQYQFSDEFWKSVEPIIIENMSKLTLREIANFAIFFGSFKHGGEQFWQPLQDAVLNLFTQGSFDNEAMPDIFEGIMRGDYKNEQFWTLSKNYFVNNINKANAYCLGTLYFTFVQAFGGAELKKDDKFQAAVIPRLQKHIKNMDPTSLFKVVCAASIQEIIFQNQSLKEQLTRRMKQCVQKTVDIEGVVNATQAMLIQQVEDEEMYSFCLACIESNLDFVSPIALPAIVMLMTGLGVQDKKFWDDLKNKLRPQAQIYEEDHFEIIFENLALSGQLKGKTSIDEIRKLIHNKSIPELQKILFTLE